MKKYLVCLTIGLLLFSVTGFCQTPVNYTLKLNLGISTDSHYSESSSNCFQMDALMSSGIVSNYWRKDGLPKSSTQSTVTVIDNINNRFQGFRFYGRRCYTWSYLVGSDENCPGGGYTNDWTYIDDYTLTGYYKHTYNDVVPGWNGNLTVEIMPEKLQLTYIDANRGVVSDGKDNEALHLPSKDKITLSCTPGYAPKVYNWQYFDRDEYVWSTTSGSVPVPCGSESDLNTVYVPVDRLDPMDNVGNDLIGYPGAGKPDYSYYTNHDYLMTYYDTHDEYNAQDFYNYFRKKLPNPNSYCSTYTNNIPKKTKEQRWIDFPDSLNHRASITFTGEELLGQAGFAKRVLDKPGMAVRINHPATTKNPLNLDLKYSAPKLDTVIPSQPCYGEQGSLALYFSRPLDPGEYLHVAIKEPDIDVWEYHPKHCNIDSLDVNNSYVIDSLPPGTHSIRYSTTIDGYTYAVPGSSGGSGKLPVPDTSKFFPVLDTSKRLPLDDGSLVQIPIGGGNGSGSRKSTTTFVATEEARSATITAHDEIMVALSSTPATCYGASDGTIRVTPSGGVGSGYYTSIWNSTTRAAQSFYGNGTATRLSADDYVVYVKDGAGCEINRSVAVAQPKPLSVSVESYTEPLCYGNSNGRVGVQARGGTSPYTYTCAGVTRSAAAGTLVWFDGLAAGTFTIQVTDSKGCAVDITDSLNQPEPLTASIAVQQAITCNTGGDGELSAVVQGGTQDYKYQWYKYNGSKWGDLYQTDSSITDRYAGDYRVEVTDAHDCTASAEYILDEPEVVTAFLSAVDVKCYGDSTGSIMVWPSGGTESSYDIELYNGAVKVQSASGASKSAGYEFTHLPEGYYGVKLKDDAGCTSRNYLYVEVASVAAPVTIEGLSPQLPGAYGASDGHISLSADGGVGAYTYTLKATATGQEMATDTSGVFAGLGEGSYTVAVKDGNQCETDTALYLPNPLLIQLRRQEHVLCYGFATGVLEIEEAKGGAGDYTYQWYDADGSISGATGLTLAGQPAGTYSVEVKDRNGLSASATCILTENSPITYGLQVEHVRCYGGTTGAMNVRPQGGAGAAYRVQAYSNAGGLLQDVQVNREDAYLFSNLKPAYYLLKLEDGVGCTAADTLVLIDSVKIPLKLSLVSNADPLGYGRTDGHITLTAAGGAAPYVYTLTADTGRIGQNNHGLFTGLGKGVYDIKLHDIYDCADSLQVVLNQPPPIAISWKSYTDIDCKASSSGSLAAHEATGGAGNFTYRWYIREGEAWSLLSSETTTVLDNAVAGTYKIEATDANGITASMTHTLQEPEFVTYTAESKPVHCYGGADGVIEAIAAGGMEQTYRFRLTAVSDKEYAVEVVTGKDTAHRFTGLRPGKYILDLADNAGCPVHRDDTDKIIIVDSVAAPLKWTDHRYHDPLAYGRNDGWVQITAEGGVAPYAFTISGASLAAGMPATLQEGEEYVADNLYEDVYHLLITDKNYHLAGASGVLADRKGCMDTLTVRLVAPPALKVNIEQLAGISCKGMRAAKLQAVGSGGLLHSGEDYHYEWYRYAGNDRQQIASGSSAVEQLLAGTYTVKITDGNNIVAWADDFVVTEPEELSVTTQTQAAVCGRDDGVAIAIAEGGTAPYTYEWNSGHRTSQANDLRAGRYMVLVKDSNRCESKAFAAVAGSDGLQLEEQLAHPTCYNYKDGSIHLQLQGGQTPYRYLWSDGDTSAMRTGLPQGVYNVQVSDAAGCRMDMIYELLHPEKLTVDAGSDRTICGGQQVTIHAAASRAIREYNWYYNGDPYDNREEITADRKGTYSVSVFDEAGCRADTSVMVKFLEADIAADFLVSGYVAVNETVHAVNISWPEPDSVRWVLPENNVTLLEDDGHSVQLRFLSTGTFEVGLLSYKEGCYESVYKTIEVVDEKDNTSPGAITVAGMKYAGVYPNPASGYFTVKIELEKDVPVTLKLFAMDGLLLKTEQLRGDTSYEYLFTMPGGIMPGIYFLQIVTPDSSNLTKLLLY